MSRKLLLLLLLITSLLNGCTYAAYSLYTDKRLMGTITDDKTLATKIKKSLMDENFTEGWSISVYSYYGHVFLVGEIPDNMQSKAINIANSYKPISVTPHWFTQAVGERNNFMLRTALRTKLITTIGISSSRIDTEVNSDRVVLLGVVNDSEEKELVEKTTQEIDGVKSVTNYLMLPQMSGQSPQFDSSPQQNSDIPSSTLEEKSLP